MTTSLRAPGVYQAPDEVRFVQLKLGQTGIPGFIGITQRGPTNEPTRIHSYQQFLHVYGDLPDGGFLADAIQGFFVNGGKVCYVLRVAHMVRRLREETARPAMLKCKDGAGKTALNLMAANEGAWGNAISVSVRRQPPRASTFLTLDLAEGDTSAVIKSTHGLARGTIVRIFDDEKETFRTVADLSGKTIVWEAARPLEHGFRSSAPTYIEPVEFSVDVRWRDRTESFQNLTLSPSSDQYVERIINSQSELIRVEDTRAGSTGADAQPSDLQSVLLQGGSDGLFTITPEDFIGANIGPGERFGLAAYEAIDEIDLLLAPDLMWTLKKSAGFQTEKDVEVVQQAMVNQCERLKTRFAILDLPDPVDHRRASQWRLLFDSAYAAIYYPWIQVDSVSGEQRLVPPSGHVAGVFAQCDQAMGVYRAPANEELKGVVDVARVLQDADLGQLNSEGINCLRSFPTRGIRIWGARTVSHDPQWRYVNVRRVVSAVIAAVEQGLQWSVFESNTPILWKTLERQVAGFLRTLWTQGFFRGATPEEAFYVKCDDETNTQEARDAGMVIIECGVAPVRPAEYLMFRIEAETPQAIPDAT